jgi:hypothetical protein
LRDRIDNEIAFVHPTAAKAEHEHLPDLDIQRRLRQFWRHDGLQRRFGAAFHLHEREAGCGGRWIGRCIVGAQRHAAAAAQRQ